MGTTIHQAWQVACQRGEKGTVGVEDILFLLRKDHVKLRRLLRYYEVRDLKNVVKSMVSTDDSKKIDVNVLMSPQDKQLDRKAMMSRNRQICFDFLTSIDQTGELVALFDDREADVVKHERMMRAELQSQGLDHQQYEDFCKARQVNFCQRHSKSTRFKEWLLANLSPSDIILTPSAVELFSYLAFETVAQIVDLALLVKQDQRTRPGDPLSRAVPSQCVNYRDPLSGGLGKGDNSGSMSPTTEPSLSSTSLSSQPSGKSASKKKRKKSGPPTCVEASWDNTILPSDVREAMRRYYTDISPFSSDMKINPQCSVWHQTLCS